ncbi:basic amino acid/polyamine antiporter, APA family [Streptomyces sp. 3213]|nr:basic amino acid/polyamine antiporter, APA family [Streptomyces sp. 3213] [Streptomyces sp. 3213.3]
MNPERAPTNTGGMKRRLGLSDAVAHCNATSSARLAARYPQSGGTYVYGRERLGPFWGYLAGWAFIVGKTASCAAMALTVGAYLWPGQTHAVAAAAVVTLTAVNYTGVQKSALLTRAIVAVVLAVLCAVAVTAPTSSHADSARLGIGPDTTLGEEVRDPTRTIPRASPIALGITLAVYAAGFTVSVAVAGAPVGDECGHRGWISTWEAP